MKKFVTIVKNEAVLIVSFLLAVVSAFVVRPDAQYCEYIDFKTLGLLFCLMAITSAFNNQGVFSLLAISMLKRVRTTRSLTMVLCMLCFFASMLITNDVALITFVPFTLLTLNVAGNYRPLIPLITLETISANLGSMLTPIGNPQNLYLFSRFHMSIGDFARTIAPYAALSLAMIIVGTLWVSNEPISPGDIRQYRHNPNRLCCVVYAVLFVLALLTVLRVVNILVLLVATVVVMLVADRRVFLGVDYSLLLTFVCLFVFIGNLGRIDTIRELLGSIIVGNEVLVGVATSQVFSNVPAALLLSGFSDNARALLVGVNLGGLGTLIASMASLISFKFVTRTEAKTSSYVLSFTVANIVFLALNLALWLIIR